ncbi:MAG: glycoside hydrolase family 16 protein [Solirubrobacterales bacterium]
MAAGGEVPRGNILVRAKLVVKHSAHVRRAIFYYNGSKVTHDRRYPFQTKKGATFNTRKLAISGNVLTVKVKYFLRARSGRVRSRSITRRIPMHLESSQGGTGGVTGSGTPDAAPSSGGGTTTDSTSSNARLLFDDEFDGGALNTAAWNTQRRDSRAGSFPFLPYNWIEGAGYATKNVAVADGSANLTVTDDKIASSYHPFTKSTGMINTDKLFSFKYGYVEARVKVPRCQGCWPSFWVMPQSDNWPPEIDIFEFVNSAAEPYPYATPHWSQATQPADLDNQSVFWDSANKQAYKNFRPAGTRDLTGEYHRYGMLWKPNLIEFYIDGVPGGSITDPARIPQEPMYLIFMMAIGDPKIAATLGVNFTWTPAGNQMQLDWVHVWDQSYIPG